jgi:hypothetical protein
MFISPSEPSMHFVQLSVILNQFGETLFLASGCIRIQLSLSLSESAVIAPQKDGSTEAGRAIPSSEGLRIRNAMTDPGVPHTSLAILHSNELLVDTEEDILTTKLEEDLTWFQLLFKVSEVLRLHGMSPDAEVTKADLRRTKFTLEGG